MTPPERPSVLVVFIGGFPGDSAAARLVQRICRGLQLHGWRPMVLSVGFSPSPSAPEQNGNDPKWRIPYRSAFASAPRGPLYNLLLCGRAARLLAPMVEEQLRAGTVRAVLFIGSTYFGFRPLVKLCERADVPALSYQLEYPVWSNWTRVATGGYFDELLYLRHALPRASGIIGISSFWASAAEALGIPFTVVPSYLPDELSTLAERAERRRPASSCFHLVTLGTWVPRECPLVVLRAVREAYRDGIPIRYTAIGRIGSSPMERTAMQMYKSDSELRKIVNVTGWVDEAQKQELMESADAFVLLRRPNTETAALFPTRLPEYLAQARPVIASDAGDLSRYLQHKNSAWLVPGDDDGTSLRAAIGELYTHPEMAHTIGRGGLARAMESFSIEGNGKKMSEFIHSVIAGRSPVSPQARATHLGGV